MIDSRLSKSLSRFRAPRLKLMRSLKASRIEHSLLSGVALAQMLYLYGWGLLCWRLGTLLLSTLFLLIVLHFSPDEES